MNAPDANKLLFRCVMIHFMVRRRLPVPDIHLQCFSRNRQSTSPHSQYRRGVYMVPVLVQQRHCTLRAKAPPFVFSISFLSFFLFVISTCSLTLIVALAMLHLLGLPPPLDSLHSHLHQTVLGLAVGEIADALDGLLGVVLRQCSCLVDAVCLEDELSCLCVNVSKPVIAKDP